MANNLRRDPPFFEPVVEFYHSLPPISRTWLTASLAVTALHTLELIDSGMLYFDYDRVGPPLLELWRVATSFCWAGPGTLTDFSTLMLLYNLAVIIPSYERSPFPTGDGRHRRTDCVVALAVCAVLILSSYLLITRTKVHMEILRVFPELHPLLLPIFTRTLLYSVISLESRRHPNRQHNINFFPVPGKLVPLFHIGFGLIMKYRINEILHGILVGYVFEFLITRHEWLGRRRILRAPQFLVQLLGEDGGPEFNNPNRAYLEPGANLLHRAAAVGDMRYVAGQIERVEALTSTGAIAIEARKFSQPDRNGWQPIHEAARSGQLDVLCLLLEVDVVTREDTAEVAYVRRAGMLQVNVNARTNNNRGYTPLRLVEEHQGIDSECCELLCQVGGVSLGPGDDERNGDD